jgi:arylsulfatase A-like enzyme
MGTRLFVALALLAAPLAAAGPPPPAVSPASPNFVVIYADDLGYGDLSCHGSATIATPRLDRMAREGVRFTEGYAASPFCSPSRAALLTGRLPARCGVPYVLFPAEHHGLPEAELTLAELLRTRGYATACIGKWHLGWAPAFRPQRHGFDVFFGTPYPNNFGEWRVGQPFAQGAAFEPYPLLEGDTILEAPVDQNHLTRRLTERAIRFIREHRDRPFLLFLPHVMPHIPQFASPAFTGRSKAGIYGDSIEELDWSTGAILDALAELGLDRRTLVVFSSDNGAGLKAPHLGPIPADLPYYAPERANGGSNGPLRAGKGTTFEGGVRVPFIVRWPGRIAARGAVPGVVSQLDLFPTFAALAGAPLPPGVTLDGTDISPLLLEGRAPPARPLFLYFGYQLQAVREGRWKLFPAGIAAPAPRPPSLWWDVLPNLFANQHRVLTAPELYDLDTDIGEKQNLAVAHPDIVAQLAARGREFDAALRRDQSPLQIEPGPRPPAPGTVRTAETDLARYRIE